MVAVFGSNNKAIIKEGAQVFIVYHNRENVMLIHQREGKKNFLVIPTAFIEPIRLELGKSIQGTI